jgi:hypothetical protein
MRHVKKVVLVASAVSCAMMLSFGWSDKDGMALSVGSAQARVGRPLTPVSVAGVARRQTRRAVYGAGAAVGVGAAAVGTAAAVAATSPYTGWNSYNPYYTGTGTPYAGSWGATGAYAMSPEEYRRRNGVVCEPGTMTKLSDGQMYRCQ